jgi:AraC-like DNA-binding protein
VARSVNLSANHLSEKFKEVTGVNFVKYVAYARYEKARALLRDPTIRVNEAAFGAGFQSLSQFNRVFKVLSGKSPTEYRAVIASNKSAVIQPQFSETRRRKFNRKNA